MTAQAASFLDGAVATFLSQKRLAERAIEQLSEAQLRQPLDENTNSVAIIMKHVAGNMLSRWTDFLTSDGEKPWRDRDREFIDEFASHQEIRDLWESGWGCLFDALASLEPGDLTKTVRIRGQEHTVWRAIQRQLSHYGYHVGQIVLTARLLVKEGWSTVTIPRGGSEEYNRLIGEQNAP
jgi:hypothetical protein